MANHSVTLFLSSVLSVVIAGTCFSLLIAFWRSPKLKRSSTAVIALVFSNALIGTVALPMWIYLMHGITFNDPQYSKLHTAYNMIDITLISATSLQLLLITYQQLCIKRSKTITEATNHLVLTTWLVGFLAAIAQAIIRNSAITMTILLVLVIAPFIFIVFFFLAMLCTDANPNRSTEEIYGATTKTGLIILSGSFCLIPFFLYTLLCHMQIIMVLPFTAELIIFFRYLNVFFVTVIYGYKSVDPTKTAIDYGNCTVGIVQVYQEPKNIAVYSKNLSVGPSQQV